MKKTVRCCVKNVIGENQVNKIVLQNLALNSNVISESIAKTYFRSLPSLYRQGTSFTLFNYNQEGIGLDMMLSQIQRFDLVMAVIDIDNTIDCRGS